MQKLKPFIAPAIILTLAVVIAAVTTAISQTQQPQPRPSAELPYESPKKDPPIITPAAKLGDAPSDAVILFDGKDLSGWKSLRDGSDAKWDVKDGYMQVKGGTGDIATKQEFADCQLH